MPPLTPEQIAFYQSFLYQFFTALGMPQIAACYMPCDGDGQTEVAGASESNDPR